MKPKEALQKAKEIVVKAKEEVKKKAGEMIKERQTGQEELLENMKEEVSGCAGKIWKALGENGEINIMHIPAKAVEKPEIAYQALGWLAREDKIIYSQKKNQVFVSLTDCEKEMFKSCAAK